MTGTERDETLHNLDRFRILVDTHRHTALSAAYWRVPFPDRETRTADDIAAHSDAIERLQTEHASAESMAWPVYWDCAVRGYIVGPPVEETARDGRTAVSAGFTIAGMQGMLLWRGGHADPIERHT